jgi:hypothetical protein
MQRAIADRWYDVVRTLDCACRAGRTPRRSLRWSCAASAAGPPTSAPGLPRLRPGSAPHLRRDFAGGRPRSTRRTGRPWSRSAPPRRRAARHRRRRARHTVSLAPSCSTTAPRSAAPGRPQPALLRRGNGAADATAWGGVSPQTLQREVRQVQVGAGAAVQQGVCHGARSASF